MGGAGGGGTGTSAGPGMMGGPGMGPGYTASRLTCSAPSTMPGTTVTVQLGDMGMMSPSTETAPLGAPMMLRADRATVVTGPVSLVAQNMGWRPHELVVLRLAEGATAGQRVPDSQGKVDETGSVGEASATCAADQGESGISSGAVGWTTVTLPPGRYELVCNLANHYADGMHQELDVSPA
jgi:uncharacterized cupredoxin-like copper-binding protein